MAPSSMFRTPGGSSASSFLAGLLLASLPTRVLFRNYAANGRGRGSADAAPFDAHLGTWEPVLVVGATNFHFHP